MHSGFAHPSAATSSFRGACEPRDVQWNGVTHRRARFVPEVAPKPNSHRYARLSSGPVPGHAVVDEASRGEGKSVAERLRSGNALGYALEDDRLTQMC